MVGFSSPLTTEMEHVTQEMYKKNLELAERNKTLLILRKIEELILSSITDINEIAQRVADLVIKDAGFKSVSLRLINHSHTSLTPLVVSVDKQSNPKVAVKLMSHLQKVSIPLNDNGHISAKVVATKHTQQTTHLYFVPCPELDMNECRDIQTALGIKEYLLYPLIIREKVIGTMTVGIGEDGELSVLQSKNLLNRLPSIISIALDNALLYKTIGEKNERLKELDKLKDDFVSIASHELRTPMTAIKSYLWMALNKSVSLEPKVREYLTIATLSTDRLIKLVANMLTISRIEGKRLQLVITEFVLQDLIHHVYDELSIKAKEQNIHLMLKTPKKNIVVRGDSDRIHEVIQNLVGNSLKFTPPGGEIIITAKEKEKYVEVSVKDTGPGMSSDDQAKLFHKFGLMGSSYSKTSNASGTGLGLYITKQILAMHKGHISVESKLGEGSTFCFTLPL